MYFEYQAQPQEGATWIPTVDVCERIDEIVDPGVNVNPADRGWDSPWLTDPSLRRREPPA